MNTPLPEGTFFEQLRAEQLIDKIKARCLSSSQKEVASLFDCSTQCLRKVISQKIPFPDSFAEKMGYEKVVTYIKWNRNNE